MSLPNISAMVPVDPPDPKKDLSKYESELLRYCDDPHYALELKWDGFRGIILYDGDKVTLQTKECKRHRNFVWLAERLRNIFKSIGVGNLILDSEIVCLNEEGKPIFKNLWQRKDMPRCYVFDLLYYNGSDHRNFPYHDRKGRLEFFLRSNGLLVPTSLLLYSQHTFDPQEKRGLFYSALQQDMEGGVFKHKNSIYGDVRLPWRKFRNPNYSQDYERARLFGRRPMRGI